VVILLKKSKYHSRKITRDGVTFDSVREYRRFCELRLLEKAGEITNLQRQVTFPLIPTQREEPCEVYQRGKNKGMPKQGKLIEKEVNYIADFVYTDAATGETIVEDAKGVKTKDYILKRKMMLYFHGIRIREV
jgi:hypothetical protein